MEPYRTQYPQAGLRLPHTEALTNRVFSLPTGTSMDPGTITTVCHLVRLMVTHYQEIRARLQRRARGDMTAA